MEQCQFFLISHSLDGKTWQPDELAEQTPIPRVRQILGGRWDTSKQYHEFVRAFFSGKRRVLVMGFPPGKTKEQAQAALQQIHEGSEAVS
jgi:hypothetical protein